MLFQKNLNFVLKGGSFCIENWANDVKKTTVKVWIWILPPISETHAAAASKLQSAVRLQQNK